MERMNDLASFALMLVMVAGGFAIVAAVAEWAIGKSEKE